jgi:ribonuclease III
MTHHQEFADSLGLQFNNSKHLQNALTHPSVKKGGKVSEFERLEFLGDRVLGLVIAECLYQRFPKEKEGSLAKRLAALVNRDICSEIAQTLQLDQHLQVTGTKLGHDSSVLADAIEALLGAIYLDQGWLSVRAFILSYWDKWLNQLGAPPKDSKTALQEWSQKNGHGIPEYAIVATEGPAHEPLFTISVKLNEYYATAKGPSRRVAEQAAAKILLEKLAK